MEQYNSYQINHKVHRGLSTKDSKTKLFVVIKNNKVINGTL